MPSQLSVEHEEIQPRAVLLYLIIFYAAVGTFFFVLLFLASFFVGKLDPFEYDSSIMGSPGLAIQPILSLKDPLIWLKKDLHDEYAEKIESILAKDQLKWTPESTATMLSNLGPCGIKPYGYSIHQSSICIFLMINKVINWKPDCYDDPIELPVAIPLKTKIFIRNYYTYNQGIKRKRFIWLSCSGESAFDRDNIGYYEYFPRPGFEAKFFPYNNPKDRAELLAVKFYDVKPNTLITITCAVYAKNMEHRNQTAFQLYIEKEDK